MNKKLKLVVPTAVTAMFVGYHSETVGMEELGATGQGNICKQAAQFERQASQAERHKFAALLSHTIDMTIQRVNDLQNFKFTYGNLMKVLDIMDEYYEAEKGYDHNSKGIVKICEQLGISYNYNELILRGSYIPYRYWSASSHDHLITIKLLNRFVKEKMEKYQQLSGEQHPHWDEFSKK